MLETHVSGVIGLVSLNISGAETVQKRHKNLLGNSWSQLLYYFNLSLFVETICFIWEHEVIYRI